MESEAGARRRGWGQIELMGWADVLDRCDEVLGAGLEGGHWVLAVDAPDSPLRPKLTLVLAFLSELFENTTSRTCFASIERLIGWHHPLRE